MNAVKENSSAAVAGPAQHPATIERGAKAASFQRQQRVLVAYGCVQLFSVVGKFAAGGRVVDRTNWRKGWFGIELNNGACVTAHASALTAL